MVSPNSVDTLEPNEGFVEAVNKLPRRHTEQL
jgi:hypothetical protein